MTLAFEFTKIPGSEYLPRPEFMSDRAFRYNYNEQDRGIWDLLGRYNHEIGTITLFEDNINDLANELSPRTSSVYPILRELVRLHEHAHAYMHTARLFENIHERPFTPKDWFKKIPAAINESLTEYIALTILEESESSQPAWIRLFHKVDSRAPSYYRKWKQARRLLRYPQYIAPIVKLARTRIWKNWDEFYEALAENQNEINGEAVLLRLKG